MRRHRPNSAARKELGISTTALTCGSAVHFLRHASLTSRTLGAATSYFLVDQVEWSRTLSCRPRLRARSFARGAGDERAAGVRADVGLPAAGGRDGLAAHRGAALLACTH
eukprot:240625-Pleurochrysis_carterae.AAC.1